MPKLFGKTGTEINNLYVRDGTDARSLTSLYALGNDGVARLVFSNPLGPVASVFMLNTATQVNTIGFVEPIFIGLGGTYTLTNDAGFTVTTPTVFAIESNAGITDSGLGTAAIRITKNSAGNSNYNFTVSGQIRYSFNSLPDPNAKINFLAQMTDSSGSAVGQPDLGLNHVPPSSDFIGGENVHSFNITGNTAAWPQNNMIRFYLRQGANAIGVFRVNNLTVSWIQTI